MATVDGSMIHGISIHALREEGDWSYQSTAKSFANFYPRPPRGGRREYVEQFANTAGISIHALREEGDNLIFHTKTYGLKFLSTPSARRATCRLLCSPDAQFYFYPRPPRGGRPAHGTQQVSCLLFLSTPSARRATRRSLSTAFSRPYFYPRPPRGGRHKKGDKVMLDKLFLSTPSARRATL